MLLHPIGLRRQFAKVFNIGPLPGWGDASTLAQCSIDPFNPLANPLYIPVLRMTVDVGNWEESRFAICGGPIRQPRLASLRRAGALLAERRGHPDPLVRGLRRPGRGDDADARARA
jgi:hypothetical protein